MKTARRLNPVLRATGIIGATAALVTGITFAALSSTATLTNNTIATGSAELLIDNTDDATTTVPGATDVGYAFTGVVPGGADSNVGNFTLTNDGDSDMSIALNLDGAPVWTVLPSGTVDDSKVDVIVSCTGDLGVFGVTTDVASLVAGPVALTGANLDTADTATCTVSISMDADAFVGSSASSDQFDFVFTGTAV